jgi:hypothetical protein
VPRDGRGRRAIGDLGMAGLVRHLEPNAPAPSPRTHHGRSRPGRSPAVPTKSRPLRSANGMFRTTSPAARSRGGTRKRFGRDRAPDRLASEARDLLDPRRSSGLTGWVDRPCAGGESFSRHVGRPRSGPAAHGSPRRIDGLRSRRRGERIPPGPARQAGRRPRYPCPGPAGRVPMISIENHRSAQRGRDPHVNPGRGARRPHAGRGRDRPGCRQGRVSP